ncbi:MerR family transcriptional regulator [Actinoplanes sp. DH11]|uniref:MerR family transcriptional regulator n=1 Tax=Actinoplanes sp. DH11 TaxID=2857011 RepID=UPI001E2C6BEE|nr:MerR family transcriptional regulator [Actinoplanes sp. DH11]
MLSISEFSEMTHLTPQALRFYHAEGLLEPAHVDERTGHRSYAFEQVEQAMLVTLLRDTGMSVKLVRQALDEPDRVLSLLDRHSAEVDRQRRAQDEAIQAARTVFDTWPAPQVRHVPAMTVATRLVHGTPLGRTAQEWQQAEAMIEAATAELVTAVEDAGIRAPGTPWRTLALETPEQDRRVLDGKGPFWIVKVPVTAEAAALPDGVRLQQQPERDELQIFMPGRNTMAKYGTVILRLLNAELPGEDLFVNFALARQEIHPDGVLSAAPVQRAPGTPG